MTKVEVDIARSGPLIAVVEGFDKDINRGKRRVHVLDRTDCCLEEGNRIGVGFRSADPSDYELTASC